MGHHPKKGTRRTSGRPHTADRHTRGSAIQLRGASRRCQIHPSRGRWDVWHRADCSFCCVPDRRAPSQAAEGRERASRVPASGAYRWRRAVGCGLRGRQMLRLCRALSTSTSEFAALLTYVSDPCTPRCQLARGVASAHAGQRRLVLVWAGGAATVVRVSHPRGNSTRRWWYSPLIYVSLGHTRLTTRLQLALYVQAGTEAKQVLRQHSYLIVVARRSFGSNMVVFFKVSSRAARIVLPLQVSGRPQRGRVRCSVARARAVAWRPQLDQ